MFKRVLLASLVAVLTYKTVKKNSELGPSSQELDDYYNSKYGR